MLQKCLNDSWKVSETLWEHLNDYLQECKTANSAAINVNKAVPVVLLCISVSCVKFMQQYATEKLKISTLLYSMMHNHNQALKHPNGQGSCG